MNRREFLKTGAGAFFIASAGKVFGAAAPSNRVRLAIVGCHEKGRGFTVMKAAMKVPGVEIACVCDVDRRAREFAADFIQKEAGVRPKTEKDFRKVLEDRLLDGVISETPDHFHAYSAVMAMRSGKAVYVEKPCCFCPEEGQVLMRVAKETGMVLQVGSQRRASLPFKSAIDFVRSSGVIGELNYAKAWYFSNRGSIGKGKVTAVPEWLDWDLWQACAPREKFRDNIVHYNWHWFWKWGTSEMGNNAPHFADAARWALGIDSFPEAVTCSGGTFFPKGDDFEWPDTFNASFVYPGGKFITFEMSCHHPSPHRLQGDQTAVIAYGDKGSLYLGSLGNAKVFGPKGELIREWSVGGMANSGTISLTNPTEALDVAHMTNFIECLRAKKQETNSNAEQGVKSSVLPLLANIAVDCGETIRIDPVTGKLASKAGEKGWAREYEKGWELA